MTTETAARIFGIASRDDPAYFDADEDIAQTRDTIADFIEAQGQPTQTEEVEGHAIYHWLASKRTGRSRTLSVIDLGEFRFAVVY